jgi:hypothetical protein
VGAPWLLTIRAPCCGVTPRHTTLQDKAH